MSNNEKCERIPSWYDGKNKHTEPFDWMSENNLAWELYYKIVQLSELQRYEWSKNKKTKSCYFPTLSKMDFVFQYYLPEDIAIDEIDDLIEKISLIHQLKLQQVIS